MLINYQEFHWKGDRLMYGTRDSGAKIIADVTWPKMYRVECPPGTVSDMTNLTRAKDAAISIVARHLSKAVESTSRRLAESVIPSSLAPQRQINSLTAPSSMAA